MNLQHHFLIALPGMDDPRFKCSVIYICEHNEQGAMGLVINKPVEHLTLDVMLKNLGIIPPTDMPPSACLKQPVLLGGPLADDHAFILHTSYDGFSSSMRVSQHTMLTSSKDVLETLATPEHPEKILVALGYAGWQKNQLEQEIIENIWLTVEANSSLLFDIPLSQRWHQAASCLGIDINRMVHLAGHA